MALINIEYGALASSEVMNNNFEYLDNRISSAVEGNASTTAAIYSNIASINSLITRTSNMLRPIGQLILRLDNTIFEDEIRLEGAEVSRTTYAELFQIYGITYGDGDGVNTFNLPDFRDRVMWGGESFGYLEPTLPNITGYYWGHGLHDTGAFSGALFQAGYYSGGWDTDGHTCGFGIDASRSSAIYQNDATVRPPSVQIRVVTRYR